MRQQTTHRDPARNTGRRFASRPLAAASGTLGLTLATAVAFAGEGKGLSGSAFGTWHEDGVLAADLDDQPDPGTDVRYGEAVAVSGNWMAVGLPTRVRPSGHRAGGVIIYQRIGGAWQMNQRLLYATATHAHCGAAVAMTGTHLVVGCPTRNADGHVRNGMTLFYLRNGTGQYAQIGSTQGFYDDDRCGTRVAIAGSGEPEATFAATTCIGAFASPNGGRRGDVKVYRLVEPAPGEPWDWQFHQVLAPPIGGAPDANDWRFGQGLDATYRSSDGDIRFTVGMPGYNNGNSGRAYVYRRNQFGIWIPDAARGRPGGDLAGAEFGYSVAIDGDHWVVGAPGDGAGAERTGRVFAYRHADTWSESGVAIIPVPDAQPGFQHNTRFGQAVALAGAELWIGHPDRRRGNGNHQGGSWHFLRVGSQLPDAPLVYLLRGLFTADPAFWLDDSKTGAALAIDGGSGTVIVGAPQARPVIDPDSDSGGRALLYRRDGVFEHGFE